MLETFYHAEMETQKKMKKFKRNDDERSSHKHSMDDLQTKSLSINDIQAIIYIYYIFSINSLVIFFIEIINYKFPLKNIQSILLSIGKKLLNKLFNIIKMSIIKLFKE